MENTNYKTKYLKYLKKYNNLLRMRQNAGKYNNDEKEDKQDEGNGVSMEEQITTFMAVPSLS